MFCYFIERIRYIFAKNGTCKNKDRAGNNGRSPVIDHLTHSWPAQMYLFGSP